jgi:chromodomain-helicase-DNA-binding protein 4
MKRLYPHLVERYGGEILFRPPLVTLFIVLLLRLRCSQKRRSNFFVSLCLLAIYARPTGLLAYFDPSGAAVRPSDRAPKGGKRKGTAADLKKKSRRSDESSSAELSDFDEPSESGGDSDNYEEDSATPLRRSHRAVIKQSHGYSPKKALRASLRQTRSTKRVSSGHSSAIDVDDISDDDYDDRYSRPSLKIKIKMTRRKREVQPGFGVVRSIEELDYESDRETASLRAHRADCEKCGRVPAHLQLLKLSKRKGRKRKLEEFEDDEEDVATALGGWVRCLHCSVSAHWKCLASPQRDDVLRAIRELDNKAAVANGDDPNTVVKKKALDVKETTEFICGSCSRGGICMGCKEVAVKLSKPSDQQKSETILGATVPTEASTSTIPSTGRATSVDTSQTLPPSESSEPLQDGASKERSKSAELVFRCKLCKRPSHYDHLHREPDDEDVSTPDLAETYQRNGWRCHECLSWQSPLDLIIAWRPYPADAVEAPLAPDEVINHKSALPREYLVKWQERSYR